MAKRKIKLTAEKFEEIIYLHGGHQISKAEARKFDNPVNKKVKKVSPKKS
jgi:hypothetical protein